MKTTIVPDSDTQICILGQFVLAVRGTDFSAMQIAERLAMPLETVNANLAVLVQDGFLVELPEVTRADATAKLFRMVKFKYQAFVAK